MSDRTHSHDDARTDPTDAAVGASDGVETAVPPDADPFVCRYCGRPFVREAYLSLHRGLAHADALSESEQSAYESAREEEVADLQRFRLVALAALVFVYFGFLFAYAVFA